MIETGNFTSRSGKRLFFRAPAFKSGGISVVIVHGFAEHSGRYSEISERLLSRGLVPFLFDLRGHGHSEGGRGFIDSFQDYVDDLKAAVEFARERNSTSKVVLLAHSMGGLVAANFAAEYPDQIEGLILSSPLFGIQVQVPVWKQKLGGLMSKYWPTFSLPSTIDPKYLTHDSDKAEDYCADPLIFRHVTARWFEEITKATENMSALSKLEKPVLLQLSEDDRIVSFAKSCEWFKACKSKDKKLEIYPGFFHEIYNERERQRPIEDFLNWIDLRWKD